jgi:formate hydrogenlyase subunit 3/multisubunit Na+/H+ antiporter MnhD subunit
MGEMAGNIVVFILMFLCAAFVVGLTMLYLRYWLKMWWPKSQAYRIFNKILWKVPVWLVASLVVSVVMWIRWLKDMGE